MTLLSKFFQFREKSDGDIVKPFLDHMEDLRWTLIKMGITVVLSMCLSFFWVRDLMRLIKEPLERVDPVSAKELITFGITDSLTISIQLAFFAGIVLALPFLTYFTASFVLPALSRQEKNIYFPASSEASCSSSPGFWQVIITFCRRRWRSLSGMQRAWRSKPCGRGAITSRSARG